MAKHQQKRNMNMSKLFNKMNRVQLLYSQSWQLIKELH